MQRRVLLGYSVRHRPITAFEIGDADSPARTLVVGCIHGNEPAGIAIADTLARSNVSVQADLWVIPDLNRDGAAAGSRGNAHGVDLNRNFPYGWRPLGQPGSIHYSGPHALSEPESSTAASLVRRLRPRLTIYYHQHLAVVDDSEGQFRSNGATSEPSDCLRALTDYPGSAVGWQDHLLGPTAFVVELPAGSLPPTAVQKHVSALLSVLPVH